MLLRNPVLLAPLRQTCLPCSIRARPALRLSSLVRMASSAASLKILADKRPIVIFGPSGVGKSTLLKKLFAEFPDEYGFSVSHTTRKPRPGEEDGVSYHFVTQEQFSQLIDAGAFLEHASFGGNSYGTTIQAVADVSTEGVRGKSGDTKARRAILDIDAQGVRIIKANHLETLSRPLFIFLSPPSFSALKQRLEGRGTETDESIRKRLAMAANELAYARTAGAADVVIVNDDVERAYGILRRACTGQLDSGGDKLPKEEKELEDAARQAMQSV